jgi:2-polyprenyl-6-methoxyphenol hydroxylase-like FAD-dependent oxidoreductase
MYFFNSRGKEIASLTTDYQKIKYNAETVQVKRGQLYSLIQQKALQHGIIIQYGKKLVRATETSDHVQVTFQDGTTTTGDLLFGCDGGFSTVRQSIFPDAPKPVFTKNIGTGGFAKLPQLASQTKGLNMTFGERGFFGYGVSNKGEIWWFNNYHREQEPTREEIQTTLKSEITKYLLDVHKNDDPVFSQIINASHYLGIYPAYDIPTLQTWHTARTCLVGDAAHAISPHVGQGASLAMEDTVCIINCLKQNSNPGIAFKNFQQLRQGRVEKMIKQARKIGKVKSKPNPLAAWFRDGVLNFFIKKQIKEADWIYGYRI